MKRKPEPTKEAPKPSATVTSTAKLSIQGHEFDLTLQELENIYSVIGEALGKKKQSMDLDAYKKALEELKKQREHPLPMWPLPQVLPINHPDYRPYRGPNRPPEVWCIVGQPNLGKHSDQRDRFGN